MKKLLVIALSFMMIFMFTACQDDAADLRDDNDIVEDNDMVEDNDIVDDPEIGNDNDEIGDNEIIDEDDTDNDFAEDTMNTSVYTRTIDDDFIEIGEGTNLGRYRLTPDLRTRFEELDLTEGDRINFKYRTNDEGERELIDIDVMD